MKSWMLSLPLLIILGSLTLSRAQDGRCTRKISRVEYYTQTFVQTSTQIYYEKCGLFNLLRCTRYRTVYKVGSRRPSRIGYRSDYECCPGWITDGENCLPTQPPTTKAVTTTTPPTTAQTTTYPPTTPTTTKTTSRLATDSTTRPINNNNNNNNNIPDTQPRSRTRSPSPTLVGVAFGTTIDYAGAGQKASSTSLLSNRMMMMGISVFAVVVFLAMSIGGVVCGVKKLCPKKKQHSARLENSHSIRRGSESSMRSGAIANGATGYGARPKKKKKMKSNSGKLTATSNPGYDFMPPDAFPNESTYEAIKSEEGSLKPNERKKNAKEFECISLSDVTTLSAVGLQKSPGKDRRPSLQTVATENEYTTFREDVRSTPEPAFEAISKTDTKIVPTEDSSVGFRKPLPKPKPKPKARIHPPGSSAPPSATNHLALPTMPKAKYIDMSKGQSSSPSNKTQDGGDSDSPRKHSLAKFPSLEESPKSSTEDCSLGLRSNTSGLFSMNASLYDHVGESRSEPGSRRGSDAKHVFPTQGMYVHPEVSPASVKQVNPGSNDKVTCTYVVGDQVPGVTPRSPLLSDSYDLVGITGNKHLEDFHDSEYESSNHYDLVVTPESRRKALKPVVTKSGYASPRQDSVGQDNYYENHRRSTASLPTSSKKLSLPVQNSGNEDVYDTVQVRDSQSRTAGKPPKVAPKKPVLTLGQDSQTPKAAIERCRSGPSMLRYAELDSVYVNTARF